MSETHNAEMVIASLRAILVAENIQIAKTFAQVALDYATNDEEALAEGRNYQDPVG